MSGKAFNETLAEKAGVCKNGTIVFTNTDLVHGLMLAFPNDADFIEQEWTEAELKEEATEVIDVSEKQDGSILAYVMPTMETIIII